MRPSCAWMPSRSHCCKIGLDLLDAPDKIHHEPAAHLQELVLGTKMRLRPLRAGLQPPQHEIGEIDVFAEDLISETLIGGPCRMPTALEELVRRDQARVWIADERELEIPPEVPAEDLSIFARCGVSTGEVAKEGHGHADTRRFRYMHEDAAMLVEAA